MARIAGVDLPRRKRLDVALTNIFGIGRTTAPEICRKAGILVETKTDDLTDQDVARLREVIQGDYNVEGDLRRDIQGT